MEGKTQPVAVDEPSGDPGQQRAKGRLVRVLQLLRLIQNEPGRWTRSRLAEHFGISSRMCANDIQLLRLAGYDIRRHLGGYRIGQQPERTPEEEQERQEQRRAVNRRRARAFRERRKAAGLCTDCGKLMAAERIGAGYVRCDDCRADAALAAERRQTSRERDQARAVSGR